MVIITATPDRNLAFVAPYDAAAIAQLKYSVPATDRQWDKANKRWVVTPTYGRELINIAQMYYGVMLTLPLTNNTAAATRTGIFKMLYLGRVKNRGNESTAYGWADGTWKLVFPESALRDWFKAEKRPGEAPTLYSVLGLKPDAVGAEIKANWRRLIRVWHPDVSKESDAAQQFMAIQNAYELLSNPATRARYDAGLALERSLRSVGAVFNSNDTFEIATMIANEYRAPLCCGYVMAEGTDRFGRFIVSKILEWQDITNEQGEILVTSWPEWADHFQERWVKT